MNEFFTDPKTAVAMLAFMVAVVSWFFRREVKRIDQALADSVRRPELEQLRKDQDGRHGENIDRLVRIEVATTGTHKRIDELYRDLPGMLRDRP